MSINQQLVDYIKLCRSSGMSDTDIRQNLFNNSWNEMDINDSFINPDTPQQIPNIGYNFSIIFNKIPRSLFVTLIAIILIGGTVFGFYAYFPELNPFRSAPYKSDQILDAFGKNGLIKSARYNTSFHFETQDKNPNLKRLVIKFPEGKVPNDLGNYNRDYNSTYYTQNNPKDEDLLVVELPELQEYFNNRATDAAVLNLIYDAVKNLKEYYKTYQRDPEHISEANIILGLTEGKYYDYSVTDNGQKIDISFTLRTAEMLDVLKSQIGVIKKNSSNFDPDSIKFKNNRVSFNEKFLRHDQIFLVAAYTPSIFKSASSLYSDTDLNYILPGSFKLDLNLGGIYGNTVGTYFKVGGKGDFEDLVFEADVEFTIIESESFLKINKLPSILMDVSKVRGEWIKLKIPDNKSPGGVYSSPLNMTATFSNEYQEKLDTYFSQIKSALSLAKDYKLIIGVGEPVKEDLNGKKAYKYLVTLDENVLPEYYKKISSDLEQFGEDAIIKSDPTADIFLRSEGFKQIVKYIKDTSDFYIWVNNDGYIVKYQYIFNYIPPSQINKTAGKQYKIIIDSEISDINGDLKIEKPAKYIEYEEASTRLFGSNLNDMASKSANVQIITE